MIDWDIQLQARGWSKEKPQSPDSKWFQRSFSMSVMYNLIPNIKKLEAQPMIEEAHFLCTQLGDRLTRLDRPT